MASNIHQLHPIGEGRSRPAGDMSYGWAGPDLGDAEPIGEVLDYLNRRRKKTYGLAFYQAARDSGIEVSVLYRGRESAEELFMRLPSDSQEAPRRDRYEALRANLHARPWRRQVVIDIMNFLGRFHDNRPFASAHEAARNMLQAQGRLMVGPTGEFDWNMPYDGERRLEDSWDGFPLRRLVQRFEATMRQTGIQQEMTELVRRRGQLHAGSGWIVWKGPTS